MGLNKKTKKERFILKPKKSSKKKKKVILSLDESPCKKFFYWNFVDNTNAQHAYRKHGYPFWDYEVITGKLYIWDDTCCFKNYVFIELINY